MRPVAARLRVLVVTISAVSTFAAVQARGRIPVPAQALAQGPAGQGAPVSPPGTAVVMGQVVDGSTGKPIADAIVAISGGSQGAVMLPTGEIVNGNSPLGADPSAPRQILVNSQGRFMFRSLSKGRYTIRASSPGYLPGNYGQNRPTGASQAIELSSDDEKQADLVVRLWKSASVSGTVVDESGEPVIGYVIRVIRRAMTGGKLRLSPGPVVVTDDRGTYRASSLSPGDYLISGMSTQTTMPVATTEAYLQQMMAGGSVNSDIFRELTSSGAPQASGVGYRVGEFLLQSGLSGRGAGSALPPAPADDGRVFAYPTLYYPAATVSAQANVISLASGEDRAGIDLQLTLMPTVRVSGIVTASDGPVRNLGVKLYPAGADDFTSDSGIEAASTATDANGSFTFLGVTPGQYTLKCLRVPRPVAGPSSGMTTIEVSGPGGLTMGMGMSSGPGAPPPALPTEPTMWANMSVTVAETDVTGLSVSLRPGVRISGRLIFEGSKAPPTADQLMRGSIQISPMAGAAPIQVLTAAKRVEADGQFSSVGFPPGRYTISAGLPMVPGGVSGWTFRSAAFSGRDVSDEGLEVAADDVSGVVIAFSDRVTELSGTVLDAKGQPDKSASVIVVPADSTAWRQGIVNLRRVRNVRTSTVGLYTLPGLPPGDYFVAAVSDDGVSEWQDPKFLEMVTRVATRVTLADGEKKSQGLTTKIVR